MACGLKKDGRGEQTPGTSELSRVQGTIRIVGYSGRSLDHRTGYVVAAPSCYRIFLRGVVKASHTHFLSNRDWRRDDDWRLATITLSCRCVDNSRFHIVFSSGRKL